MPLRVIVSNQMVILKIYKNTINHFTTLNVILNSLHLCEHRFFIFIFFHGASNGLPLTATKD